MKKTFLMTSNVKRATTAVNEIVGSPPGIPRMALIYGDPGLGKTETALYLLNNFYPDGAFIRVKKISSARWLLENIVSELGMVPAFRASDLFEQIVEALIGSDRVIFYDEVDYLASDARVLETLRDIHDITGSPAVFMGMEHADKKLRRYRHLWRRFSRVIKFAPLGIEDVKLVLPALTDVKIKDDVYPYIMKRTERGSEKGIPVDTIYKWAQNIESLAKANKTRVIGLKEIDGGRV